MGTKKSHNIFVFGNVCRFMVGFPLLQGGWIQTTTNHVCQQHTPSIRLNAHLVNHAQVSFEIVYQMHKRLVALSLHGIYREQGIDVSFHN